MLEKKELLSVVKDQELCFFFFSFFWSVIGKTPFENNKDNFFTTAAWWTKVITLDGAKAHV